MDGEEAIQLVEEMLGQVEESWLERRRNKVLAGMMGDPRGKAFAMALTDQTCRTKDPKRIADQIEYLVGAFGIPSFLPSGAGLLLKGARFWPQLIVKLLRHEMSRVILPGERLAEHIQKRQKEGVRVNLNHLGEAILGEQEAARRLQVYLEDLQRPEVKTISVKISTICSKLNLLAYEQTLELLAAPLRKLYRSGKMVNLDMEEHRDLGLTVDLFKKVLSEEEFLQTRAGIVLQAYIPESFAIQRELTEWARVRGGAPIRIRIVKGANLAMEQVEASLTGWEQAPYTSKVETDANFKRMVRYGCQNTDAVHIGVGSHNLFDIAFTLLNRPERGVTIEMLEGMAEPLRRVVQEKAGDLLLYCPTATKEEFPHAMAYLIRRLDENTGPENFLRHLFDLKPGSDAWKEQVRAFQTSLALIDQVSEVPRRTQNRLEEDPKKVFVNEPVTDFSIPANREWAKQLITEGKLKKVKLVKRIPRLKKEWKGLKKRAKVFTKVAQILRARRGELIRAMIFEGNKTIPEADNEVSEAIDFVEYYRKQALEMAGDWTPKGTVLVTPPWNFPCAIPTSGVAAALITGNRVLFKPAPETPYVAKLIAKAFWDGGVPKKMLHFVPCDEETLGTQMIQDPRVDLVVLTGATETAENFLKLRPGLDLLAETGGKNSMILSNLCDRDLAIRDLVQSAFGHAGQKCSAASLAIIHAELYDDPRFREQLRDAVASLRTGPAWDLTTEVNPLIRPAEGKLLWALTTLDAGEKWLVQPQQLGPQTWTPGVKLHVKVGSKSHQTEFFGPVLSLMRYETLEGALELANGTPYGLTAGIHTLDEREKAYWTDHMQAGNLYINRGITGAIVGRQPFGGCKASSFGPGAKVGGPHYLYQFVNGIEAPKLEEEILLQDLLGEENILRFKEGREQVISHSYHRYGT